MGIFKSKEQPETAQKTGRWDFRALMRRKANKEGQVRSEPGRRSASANIDPSAAGPTLHDQSYWDRAYNGLEKAQPELIHAYEDLLSQEPEKMSFVPRDGGQPRTPHPLMANATAHDANRQIRQARLDMAIEKILEQDDVSSFKKHVSQAANLALHVKGLIGEAVKASPEASVAWAGVCVILPLLTNPQVAEQGRNEGLPYITDRMRYWAAFNPMLQSLIQSPEVHASLMEETEVHVVKLYQELLQYQLQIVLRLHKGSIMNYIKDVYDPRIWKDRKERIENLQAEVRQDLGQINDFAKRQGLDILRKTCKQSLHELASLSKMSDESIQKMDQLLSVAEQQLARQGETNQLLQNQAKEKMSEHEMKCHQVFLQVNNDTTYETYKYRVEDSVEGTCQWFLGHETFKHWLEQDSGVLLVSAEPGCGKSVLAKRLIDHELPRSADICYFFFKDGDSNTTLTKALCALLHQLFKYQPALIQHAMPAYKSDGNVLVHNRSSLWTILQKAVQDPQAKTIIIVLDALDECVPAEFEELMRSLKTQFQSPQTDCGKIKYLLTTRPYPTVIDAFNGFSSVRIPGEEHSDDISKEVDLVIAYQVKELAGRKDLSPTHRDLLMGKLCATPQRTYLWVYLMFKHLLTADFKITDQGIRSVIAKLPKDIPQAYESILNKSTESRMARKVLSIMLAAPRPLTVTEMQCAVYVDDADDAGYLDLERKEDFEKKLRNWCGLIVSVHREKLYFLHMTVKDFLHGDASSQVTNHKVNLGWQGSITEVNAQAILARCCVVYLDLFNRDAIPWDTDELFSNNRQIDKINADGGTHNASSSLSRNKNSPDADSPAVKRTAFLRYAAENWGNHCRASSTAIEDAPTVSWILRVCDPQSKAYMAWFPIFWYSVPGVHIITDQKATKEDRKEAVKGVFKEAAKANSTSLIIASLMGLQSVVQNLLEGPSRDDIEMTGGIFQKGRTALLWACLQGHQGVVEQLLAKGANIEAKDYIGRTPLSWACQKGHEGVVEQLLAHGARTEIPGFNGETPRFNDETPLMYAAWKGKEGPVKLLLENGVNVNAKDDKGRTALGQASTEEIVHILLENGAEMSAEDQEANSRLCGWASTYDGGDTTPDCKND